MIMNAVVVGGAGFIGTHLTELLLSEGYNVTVIDKLTYASNEKFILDLIPKVKLLRYDITDYDNIYSSLKSIKPDAIYHLAAESHVDNSIANSHPFIHTNIVGTHSILESVRKLDIPLISYETDEVYGDIIEGSFSEKSNLNTRSPYAASKGSAHLLTNSYIETYGIKVIMTRPSNAYGQRQNTEKLIPKTITNAINNKKIPVYGNGNNVRDWLYVKDLCIATLMLYKKGSWGEIYNISGRNELRNLDVIKKILNIMNKPYDLIEYVQERKGHDKRYSCFSDKIEKLGWKPITSFDNGLKTTIDWYKSNYL